MSIPNKGGVLGKIWEKAFRFFFVRLLAPFFGVGNLNLPLAPEESKPSLPLVLEKSLKTGSRFYIPGIDIR